MAAYIRLEGVDPEDLDDVEGNLFGDLANSVFNQLRVEHPGLFEELDGAVPVRHPETDPRLLQTTPVYAHRDASVDDGISDFVFCTFDDSVDGLDAPGAASATEYVEIRLIQRFDGERESAGDDPVRVGTLYYTSERVLRVDFDSDALDGDDDGERAGRAGAGTRGP